MKFTKIKSWLYKYAFSLGIVLLLFSTFLTWSSKPAIFYPQKTGIVTNITQGKERSFGWKGKKHFETYAEATRPNTHLFEIDRKLYGKLIVGNKTDRKSVV